MSSSRASLYSVQPGSRQAEEFCSMFLRQTKSASCVATYNHLASKAAGIEEAIVAVENYMQPRKEQSSATSTGYGHGRNHMQLELTILLENQKRKLMNDSWSHICDHWPYLEGSTEAHTCDDENWVKKREAEVQATKASSKCQTVIDDAFYD